MVHVQLQLKVIVAAMEAVIVAVLHLVPLQRPALVALVEELMMVLMVLVMGLHQLNNKMKKINSSYVIVLFIALIVIVLGGLFFIMSNNTKLITKDPATIALAQTDVFNIPSGLVYNSSISEQTYKVGPYWVNDSQLQAALSLGFTNGYYDYFYYKNPNTSVDSGIKTVGSSISIYNQSVSAQISTSNNLNQIIKGNNCVTFNLPTIGDASFGCYFIWNDSNTVAPASYYEVLFYKNNVAVRTWVGQTGIADLSSEAVQYANIVASRI
jgi:hypothetical protein